MEPEEDAFGQMLIAYYNDRSVSEIVERDDGLTNAIFAKGYFSSYEDWHPIEQESDAACERKSFGCWLWSWQALAVFAAKRF